ncbi:MAG: Ureidoglycolate lyase [Alphaproteobacteria bacterium MarineAlpha11_Bin1]|nr:MAG: Ureidoglycolate lyase [Alphaproteobacteria bacterium MarineAlpha11_Bin1]|tara:strand:+ start:2302 stop:3237 length:936 start_codon:yes stop_codon:yes gene_type:complete
MKLLTVDKDGGNPGVIMGNGEVLNLARIPENMLQSHWRPGTVREILELGDKGIDRVCRMIGVAEENPDECLDAVSKFSETSFLPPVPNPWLIFSVGMNYGRHLAEMDKTPPPPHPAGFIKTRDSLLGAGKAIPVPPQCPDMIDYEGELCFVFGRECHRVKEAEAMDYVAGYTIANDVSARDWIPDIKMGEPPFGPIHGWERNIMGKNLPGFTPCGPVIVTKDEIRDPHDLILQTRLNGKIMQNTKTDDLIFKLPEIISYYSQWYRFRPGDIVTTGSPAGVGIGRDPQIFMKAGDIIEIELESVGVLTNTLV